MQAHRLGGGHVAAHDPHAVVVDDDAVGDGIEGLLPDALGRAERVQEARVVERERGHLGQTFELLALFGGEAVVLAVADGQDAEGLAARAQADEGEVAHALGAVQRELAHGQVSGEAAHLDDRLVVLHGGGALGELAAQRVDHGAAPRLHTLKAARREPGDRAVFDGEAGDARRVGAQDAPHGLHDRAERRRALGAWSRAVATELESRRALRPAAEHLRRPPVTALRHLDFYLARIRGKAKVKRQKR